MNKEHLEFDDSFVATFIVKYFFIYLTYKPNGKFRNKTAIFTASPCFSITSARSRQKTGTWDYQHLPIHLFVLVLFVRCFFITIIVFCLFYDCELQVKILNMTVIFANECKWGIKYLLLCTKQAQKGTNLYQAGMYS